jgi:adenylate kinase family enzyme
MADATALVVNLFGGPGCGKSTMAARIFSDLKMAGVNCELVTEYAKRKTWEESFKTLQNQIYVFGKQQFSMWVCSKHVDVIVTDSPLLLSCIYGNDSVLNNLVLQEFNKYQNINIFVKRASTYVEVGRNHTEEEALEKDAEIKSLLIRERFSYIEELGSLKSVSSIHGTIINALESRGQNL